MARYCYLLLCCLVFTSCAAQKRSERARLAALQYGMTHAQALAVITDRNEILLGEFNFPEGKMQAYQYARYGADAFKVPKYYLYFLNDTLVRKSPEEDLRQGAKLALKDHKNLLTERAENAKRKADADAEATKREAVQAQKEAAHAQREADDAARRARQAESRPASHTTEKPAAKSKPKKSRDDDDDEEDW